MEISQKHDFFQLEHSKFCKKSMTENILLLGYLTWLIDVENS